MPPLKSPLNPPAETLDEVRQLNAMFLQFLRDLSDCELEKLGLSAHAVDAIRRAGQDELDRAARFPRALFRLHLPTAEPETVSERATLARDSRTRVLSLVLLHSARNLSRSSGYWARLLLWLHDDEVDRLRAADVAEIVTLSLSDDVVRAASDASDWIWRELLTEDRPEYRRRLLLIGFQPELAIA